MKFAIINTMILLEKLELPGEKGEFIMKSLNELLFNEEELENVENLEKIQGSLPHLERACGGRPYTPPPKPGGPERINPNSK